MSSSVSIARSCSECGEQLELTVDTDGGEYDDDLAALFAARNTDLLLVEAHCECDRPRSVALEAALAPKSGDTRRR